MKKRMFIFILGLAIISGAFTGCGQKKAAEKEISSGTEEVQKIERKAKKGQENNPEVEKLIKQENDILEANMKIWSKVFEKVDNGKTMKAMDEGQAYLQFLKEAFDHAKGDLSDEEQESLKKDLKKIEDIENQLKDMEAGSK